MRPRAKTLPASVTRRTTTRLRRFKASSRRFVSGVSVGIGGLSTVRIVWPSRIAGDGRGVEEPERGSFRPRNPLCKLALGAGRPFK